MKKTIRVIAKRTGLHRVGRGVRTVASSYPLLFIAAGFGVAVVLSSLVVASNIHRRTVGSFNVDKVLPQPITQPSPAGTVFTAETIKQYDGKNGRQCFVAVGEVVYEIAGKSAWQNGQHTPSDGQAYCGADLTDVIGRSPHGTSILSELPKVGAFKKQ